MLLQTPAFVLKIVKYSESSVIAKILSREKGVQSLIVKGVRSSRAKNKAAIWQAGNMLDLILYFKNGNNLKNIREFKLRHIYNHIQGDMFRTSMLVFISEVLNAVLKEEDDFDSARLFEFAEKQILLLDAEQRPSSNFHLDFLLRLSVFLGIYPNNNYTTATPFFQIEEGQFVGSENKTTLSLEKSEQMHGLMTQSIVQLSGVQRAALLEAILTYYRYQMGDFGPVRSHLIYHQVFAGS